VIVAVTGTPGSGKSFRAVHSIVGALKSGKWVVTNVALQEGWEDRLAGAGLYGFLLRVFRRRVRLAAIAAGYRRRVYYARDLGELERVRIPCAKCGRRHGTRRQAAAQPEVYCAHQPKEGRALAVIDEAFKWLNNRAYNRDDREAHVVWFKLHRKLGVDVELIEQHFDSIDKHIRDLVEFVVRLRNLRNVRFGGVHIIPFNLFLAIHVWNQGPVSKRHVAKRQVYTLDWSKGLYDTFATFHGVDELPEERMIWLGDHEGGRLELLEGVA
jgi:KaiC/GvpD/RAD55 family RecA-like ATPase